MNKSKTPPIWKIKLFKITNFINKIMQKMFDALNPSIRDVWEVQYIKGEWDHLGNLEQLAHYSVIIGYFQALKHGGSILDVGCGTGIIQERLGHQAYSKYVGIDISSEAIKRASQKSDQNTYFIEGDVRNYTTKEPFDAIIFNEILYYFDKASILELMQKYEQFLKKDGIFIVSMYVIEKNETIWRMLESIYPIVDMTKITNRFGHSWKCKVFLRSDHSII